MSRRSTYTPDWGGYAVAVLMSIGLTITLLTLSVVPDGDVADVLATLMLGTMFVTLFALPTAPVGVLLVHLACRQVRAQWVHVLAAGVAGLLTGLAFQQLVVPGAGPLEGWPFTLVLGIATAIGRASVIPLAVRRQP